VTTFWQVYLTIYLLFFRLNRNAWPPEFNADQHKGTIGAALVLLFLLIALWTGTALAMGTALDIGKPAVVAITIGVLTGSYLVLIIKKAGIHFERDFDHQPPSRRIWLRAAATALSVGSFGAMILLAMMYRHKFHPEAG